MEKLFNVIGDIFHKIFNLPLSDLTFIEFIIACALAVLLFLVIRKVVRCVRTFFRSLFKFVKVHAAASEKCKKIQCTTCGRTLDKCVCQKNKGKSNFARLHAYKKEMKRR